MQRIGLIRFSALGDIQLTEAIPRLLKARQPDLHITYITKHQWADLPAGWPAVDDVLALEAGESLADFSRRLKAARLDKIIDLHNNLRSRYLAPFAPRLPKHRLDKLLLVHARALLRFKSAPPPVWQRYLQLAGISFVSQDELRPQLVIEGERLLAGSGNALCLIPGSGRASKTWPADLWLDFLGRFLSADSRPVVILGGKTEAELGQQLAELNPDRVTTHCGRSSLAQSARLLAECRAVLCGDTGLMHMADAAGLPGIVLACSSHQRLGFWPSGGSLRVLEVDLDCRPCSHVGRKSCPKGHFNCARQLSPATVLEQLLEVMA
jgi:ADP-heptose:LPS heptosyltransferase